MKEGRETRVTGTHDEGACGSGGTELFPRLRVLLKTKIRSKEGDVPGLNLRRRMLACDGGKPGGTCRRAPASGWAASLGILEVGEGAPARQRAMDARDHAPVIGESTTA